MMPKKLKTQSSYYQKSIFDHAKLKRKSLDQHLNVPSFKFYEQTQFSDNKSKDEIISLLKNRNIRLKTCIYQVQESQKHIQEIEKQQKQMRNRNITGIYSSANSLKKQLQGVYRKVQFYQKDICRFKKQTNSAGKYSVTQKIEKLDEKLREQKNIKERLKNKMLQEKKIAFKLTKQLQVSKNGNIVKRQTKSLIKQIEYLKEKVKQMQENQSKRISAMKKQSQFIKKLQIQIVQCGYSQQYLKSLLLKSTKLFKKTQTKHSIQENIEKMSYVQSKQQQKRSFKQSKVMEHSIKVLEKSIKEQQKKIISMKLENQTIFLQHKDKQSKSQALNQQISNTQQKIKDIRKIIPKFVPNLKYIDDVNNNTVNIKGARKKYSALKNKNYIQNLPQQDKTKLIIKPFSDLQKQKEFQYTISKMTGVIINISSMGIIGIKIIYDQTDFGDHHIVNIKQQSQEQKFICVTNEFITNIICKFYLENSILSSLTLITSSNRYYTLGRSQKQKQSRTIELAEDPLKVPTCIYGQMGQYGIVNLWADVCDIQDLEQVSSDLSKKQ